MSGNIAALGTSVNLISDVFRLLFFFIDGAIYSLIPAVYGAIYDLYDFSVLFQDNTLSELVNRMTTSIYSFLSIFMFFRVAFSLIVMLVDPNAIDDKEKGAKKIVSNIMICLVLIIVVPTIFKYAKQIQATALEEHWIERIIIGESFSKDESYNLGNEFALSVWGLFLRPATSDSSANDAYNAVFKSGSSSYWDWDLASLSAELLSVSGVPVLSDIFLRYEGTHYDIAYTWFFSTLVGVYVLWTFFKLMIDVAYRSIKFFALELISPIAIVSYIDPSSSKKGLFSKWLNETVKTYISLFVRIFVFAFATLLLRTISLSSLDVKIDGFSQIIYFFAILAFIKMAPKFIDNLFGTSISKESDTKFAADMFKGALGGLAIGATGAITGAHVAGKMGQNVVKGAFSGGWTGFTKGYSAAKKGSIPGVVNAGMDTYSATRKKYGYEFNKEEEAGIASMEPFVEKGKEAKAAAIAQANANNKEAIKKEFNRDGKPAREVNGYEVTYGNLVGNADAEGAYMRYVSTVAENEVIPGLSEEGKKAYNNAAEKKMYATLSKMQSNNANEEFNVEYSAFTQRDAAGREAALMDAFNKENARRASVGEKTYTDWQTMYKEIGGVDASKTITVEDAFKISLDDRIKQKTGHTTSEWSNIAGTDESDAQGASEEVKRHEASSKGLADKKKKDLYGKAKGKLKAQSYKPTP